MVKKEMSEDQKKEQRAQELERRTAAVLRLLVLQAKKQPDARRDALDVITHSVPMKALQELVEDKTLKQDYIDWIKEEYPNIIKRAGSGASSKREKVVREYPSWISEVENPPAKLLDAGRKFWNNLQQFKDDNADYLNLFANDYQHEYKDYFRLVKQTD